jgi:hypothetical protein
MPSDLLFSTLGLVVFFILTYIRRNDIKNYKSLGSSQKIVIHRLFSGLAVILFIFLIVFIHYIIKGR